MAVFEDTDASSSGTLNFSLRGAGGNHSCGLKKKVDECKKLERYLCLNLCLLTLLGENLPHLKVNVDVILCVTETKEAVLKT